MLPTRRSRHGPGPFNRMPLIARRGVVFLICIVPLIMTGVVLIQAVGGETPLISLSRLLTFCLFVGFVWWFVRSPIMATAGLLLAGLIWWSWQFGWTPEAW